MIQSVIEAAIAPISPTSSFMVFLQAKHSPIVSCNHELNSYYVQYTYSPQKTEVSMKSINENQRMSRPGGKGSGAPPRSPATPFLFLFQLPFHRRIWFPVFSLQFSGGFVPPLALVHYIDHILNGWMYILAHGVKWIELYENTGCGINVVILARFVGSFR